MAVDLSAEDIQQQIASAIRALRAAIRWKPGKGEQHLAKRKRRGHLSSDATLAYYHGIIAAILDNDSSRVYRYDFAEGVYGVVRGTSGTQEWVVIFGIDGIMETAFPPKEPDEYVSRRKFELLGVIEEVLT